MKDQFHRGEGVYLLSHSVGLQPKSCAAAIEASFLQPWSAEPEQVWPNWIAAIDVFRDKLASLLNTQRELLCPQVNLSSAYIKVLQSIKFLNPKKRVVLMSESDFPSMVFVAEKMQAQGLQLRLIPAAQNPCDLDVWRQYLQDDVAVVMLSHVYSNTGQRLDIAGVAKIARAKGIKTIVDIAQSVGVIPIDIQQWPVDFILGSCVKWLCGGPGAAFLWVDQEQLDGCLPIDVGWFSHQNPFEFDIYNFRYHPSALRFWGGTPSVLPYACAANSIALHLQQGVEFNYRHNRLLSRSIIDALPQGALQSPGHDLNRGGTLVIHLGAAHEAFVQRLIAANIKFDSRASGIRISPHVYNCRAEVEQFLACLE